MEMVDEERKQSSCIRFRLPGMTQMKLFVNAIACMGKIGKEMTVEVNVDSKTMVLRTLNDSHSASNEFFFKNEFFETVYVPSVLGEEAGADTPVLFKCKVYLKTIEAIFRNLRQVNHMDISVEIDPTNWTPRSLVFVLDCQYQVKKRHYVRVSDCQIMSVMFDTAACENRLTTRTFHLSTLLGHIHSTSDVSVTATTSQITLQSYYSNPADVRSHLQTETIVNRNEFNRFVYDAKTCGDSTELIFCLRECKALLHFCQASDVDEVTMYYRFSGSPMVLSTDSPHITSFYGQLTLSTMTTFSGASQSSSSRQSSDNGLSTHITSSKNDEENVYPCSPSSSSNTIQSRPTTLNSSTKRKRLSRKTMDSFSEGESEASLM